MAPYRSWPAWRLSGKPAPVPREGGGAAYTGRVEEARVMAGYAGSLEEARCGAAEPDRPFAPAAFGGHVVGDAWLALELDAEAAAGGAQF